MSKLQLLMACVLISCIANAQIKMPAASTSQTVKQAFGLSTIELSYSRPSLKGRAAFGPKGVRPYDVLWRTGANSATTLTFGDDVTLGGTKIPAGKYGLLTIPGQNMWTVIISKQTDVTANADAYKKEQDAARIQVKPASLPLKVETMSISFNDITNNSCNLYIAWDKTAIKVPITTDVDSKVMASINESMKSEKPAYYQAGLYYLENNKDAARAAEWLGKAATAQPDAYWVNYQYARALSNVGKKAEAKAAALKSKALAQKNNNPDYVKLNDDLLLKLK